MHFFFFLILCLDACYAFPAADCTYAAVCLEYEKSTEKRQSPFPILSAQEIINCVHEFFPISEEEKARWAEVVNPRFGYPSSVNKAFNYIKERGLCSEKHFPFEGVKGPCVISSKVKLKVYSDYTKITDREKILQCLGKQPLAVSIPFVRSLEVYDGKSVYKGPTKYEKEKIEAKRREGQVIPLHALQVVGWGYEDVEKKKLFYLCKNSWGRGWGHKGFIKVAKDVVESGRASYAHSTYFGVPKA